MRTLGVDLSTVRGQTALCLLRWEDGTAVDPWPARTTRGTPDEVVDAMGGADRVGIDAPFGWPDDFRAAIDAWSETGTWIAGEDRRPLRLRRTDRLARDEHGLAPMSVSADRIGATAMLCADILHRHAERTGRGLDRVGGHAVEVYPAGALRAWGLPATRYKGSAGRGLRTELVNALSDRGGLALTPDTKARCASSDHVLDALICALCARAVAIGQAHPPPARHDARIAREGWIHLPLPGSLGRLARGS